ncbi:NGG1p interacting factor NIF3 [Teredinibacter franksiae]|jgi:Uncharacterized protein conserved in bacteria|uniref:NGG1p interacting factor NIF3 n=1 Tax=Teredinibacter franksiae TaxID=2761453 RepID=UPI0016278BDD|nr:NGG1p interacting factor NIF3 [Teredinibacter franksiae]
MYQFVFYVPESYVESVKQAVFDAGGGRLGHYDSCCWQTLGVGQFRANAGANPFIGEQGQIETVQEYRVELVVQQESKKAVITAMKQAHPYEEPAWSMWALVSD